MKSSRQKTPAPAPSETIMSELLAELASTRAQIAQGAYVRCLAARADELEAAITVLEPITAREASALALIVGRELIAIDRAAHRQDEQDDGMEVLKAACPRPRAIRMAKGLFNYLSPGKSPAELGFAGLAGEFEPGTAPAHAQNRDLLLTIAHEIGSGWDTFNAIEQSMPSVEIWDNKTKRMQSPTGSVEPPVEVTAARVRRIKDRAADRELRKIAGLQRAASVLQPRSPRQAAVYAILFGDAVKASLGGISGSRLSLDTIVDNVARYLLAAARETDPAALGLGAYLLARPVIAKRRDSAASSAALHPPTSPRLDQRVVA